MKYHDESRPRLSNGRLCWEGSMIALPTVNLSPGRDSDRWNMMVMNGGNGRWMIVSAGRKGVEEFLSDWRDDPERAFEKWFGEAPPKGLGSREEGAQLQVGHLVPGAKTAKDLGF